MLHLGFFHKVTFGARPCLRPCQLLRSGRGRGRGCSQKRPPLTNRGVTCHRIHKPVTICYQKLPKLVLIGNLWPMSTQNTTDRNRINLTLPDNITKAIDRCATITGQPKTALVMQALVEGLPVILERAEALERSIRGKK